LSGSGGNIQLQSTAGSISISGGVNASGGGTSGYGQRGNVQLQTTTGNISVNGSFNASGASGSSITINSHGGSISISSTGSIITSANTIISGSSLQLGSHGGDLILNAANNINIGGPATFGAGASFSLTAPQLNIGGNIQLYPSSLISNSTPLLLGLTGTIAGS
jgi:hypothetical protein